MGLPAQMNEEKFSRSNPSRIRVTRSFFFNCSVPWRSYNRLISIHRVSVFCPRHVFTSLSACRAESVPGRDNRDCGVQIAPPMVICFRIILVAVPSNVVCNSPGKTCFPTVSICSKVTMEPISRYLSVRLIRLSSGTSPSDMISLLSLVG